MDYRDRVLAARRASDSQPQEALARWTSEMQTYNGLLKGYREYLDGEFIDAAQADAEIRQAKGWQHENVVVSEINPYRNNREEHPELDVGAPYIDWELDDGFGDLLPRMKSDVTLACGEVVLIIDAKYYSHATQLHFDRRSIHSANLYQIFTYVKNKEAALAGAPHEVSGMLLYARTDEDVQPEGTYQMSGNRISVRTLGLDMPFEDIRAQLDAIVDEHFQKNKTRVWEQTS